MVGLFSNIFDPRSGAASAVIKQTSSRVILWPTIGQRAVAEETALRLARNLGGSATIWQCLRAT
jgi:plasmid maintenance system antidote protein VapI